MKKIFLAGSMLGIGAALVSAQKPAAPEATHISDYTPDGFTAHWSAVPRAEGYKVTVYEKQVADAITIEDFEGLNIIEGTNKLDKGNPGFSEGWSVVFGNVRNADHVSLMGYEGSCGMIFRTTGEGFVTPLFERDIKDFSFYAVHPSGEECLSTLVVSVLVDGEWGAIGNYDVERISDTGEIIRLSSNLPEGVRQIQVYFRKNEQYDAGKDVSVIIDHIRIMTDPEGVPVLSDVETTETSYVVSGLDSLKDYSFTVRTCRGDAESTESNELTASGLCSPELNEASAVTPISYVASWNPSPKAEGYVVSNYKVYNVLNPEETVNILYEDFEKVTEGTVSNPVGLYNVVHPRALDNYTINPGWFGIATYLAEGMLGTRSYMGITGVIQTPTLNLSGNGGAFEVKVKVIGDTDATDEYLVVQAGYEDYKMFQISPTEVTELIYQFDCGQPDMALLLYSYGGFPLFIDEITVTQTLPHGSKVFTEVENRRFEGNDTLSTIFEGLEFSDNVNYAYRVFAYRDFMGDRMYSVSKEAMEAGAISGIEEVDIQNIDAYSGYFTLDGRRLSSRPTESGIYVGIKDGKPVKFIVK